MPSPFPGMNPYLETEDAWHDFHERFMPLAAEIIGEQVGPNYIVKIDEQVYIHELSAEERRFLGRADVFVSETDVSPQSGAGAATADAPAYVRLPAVDVVSESTIEIRDRRNRQLVTEIELLSPSNKAPGPDRLQYLAKRGRLLSSRVNFVEIDLLRGGPRMPMTELPACDYCILVSRAEERPKAGVWPVKLRERLPEVPIPLRPHDSAPLLDLQTTLHRIYDAGRYWVYVYEERLDPPLSRDDAAWAAEIVKSTRGNGDT
jgi:hypothetical protein